MPAADWSRLLLLSVLWGGSFFFVGVAVGHLPALTLVWLRVALASGLLALCLAATGARWPRGAAVWAALAVMGLLNNAVPFTLFVVAQGQIGSGLAAILNATTPLWTVLVAHLATADEKITPARLAGLALGLAGVIVLTGGAGGGTLLAQGACLLAAFFYALAGVWGRRFRRMGLAPLATAWGQLTASAVILLPLMLWWDRPWMLGAPSPVVAGAVLGLAALSTALAYLIYFRLLASAGAVKLALVTFLIPVSALALGVGILGEDLLPRHLAGMALIGAGLAAIDGRLLQRRR